MSDSRLDVRITHIPDNFAHANSYIIHGNRDYLIDPSFTSEKINISKIGLLIVTHCHFDHIRELAFWHDDKGIKLVIPKEDEILLHDEEANCSFMFGQPMTFSPAEKLLADNEILELEEGLQIRVFHTPGHSPGCSCYLLEQFDEDAYQPIAFISGDTIFANSIGRTDLKYGSMKDMQSSLKRLKKIFAELPKDLPVLPGHGQPSTVGQVLAFNPYLSM